MDIIFGEVTIYLPKTIEAISTAKKLLGLVEDEIVSSWVCKHCGCTESTPCAGGCSWVAPNVCSRCDAENAPEIPEPETLRNISPPARESSATAEKSLKCPDSLKNLAPPAKVASLIASGEPETQGNKIPDSHSGGATFQSQSTEQLEKQPLWDHNPNQKSKLGTPDTSSIMQPSNLKIPKFKYDKSQMQSYKNVFFQEFPDGTVVLEYNGSHYYTTKENVLKIRYPFPKKYFSKENGWSSSIEIAFKRYRQYLTELPQPQQQLQQQAETEKEGHMPQNQKQEQEDPDDWMYKPLLKTNTRTDYDGGKIEGTLEG